jgi:hypothetical protein
MQSIAGGQATSQSGVPKIQKKCSCGGACAGCSGKEEEIKGIQTKLTIGPANDVYEHEADRVADQVMRMPDSSVETKNDQPYAGIDIQRIAAGEGSTKGSNADIKLDRSGGRPLSLSTRRFMEPRFGVDFGHVRFHTDQKAHQTASQVQAKAFTYGDNIWLGKGENEGDKCLMAHELTHVVQQGAASPTEEPKSASNACVSPEVQRTPRAQCPGGVKNVTVDMVSLRGSSRNPFDELAFANTVFRPCCVKFTFGSGASVSPGLSDTWLGGDTDLTRKHSCTNVHAEEEAMRAGATSNFSLSSRIRVFYVASMTPSLRGVSFPPLCSSGARARFLDHAYISNIAARRSLAHEFGHILLDSRVHPADKNNLMHESNTATGETLEPSQCTTIFNNA